MSYSLTCILSLVFPHKLRKGIERKISTLIPFGYIETNIPNCIHNWSRALGSWIAISYISSSNIELSRIVLDNSTYYCFSLGPVLSSANVLHVKPTFFFFNSVLEGPFKCLECQQEIWIAGRNYTYSFQNNVGKFFWFHDCLSWYTFDIKGFYVCFHF